MEIQSWRRMDKQELELQYSPSRWTTRTGLGDAVEAHVQALTEGTRRAQSLVRTVQDIQYGDTDSETMDMYLPAETHTGFPLLVYIHGGYWQLLSKEESGFLAPPLVSRGIAVMAMDYDIAPKGHMDLMVSQVRRSIAATLKLHPQITEVYLCGHSAGAHLAAMALSKDWSEYGVTPNVKGALLVSGVYDLLPLLPTYVNDPMNMTEEVAARNSPMQCIMELKKNAASCHMAVVEAEHDSPEFRRQSRDFFQSLQSVGLPASLQQVGDTDHFDVIERLSEEEYALTQGLLKMILGK
ncbi:kynurenine formamidase isoform X1 [Hyperolius riggenbachi]|uniref:kynurenine formamidase isoform X1 n=1 Tax=Hyperolius riggenbachi TaxID=752182 RepID=UPI0035A345C4